jgi:hypothetical protein
MRLRGREVQMRRAVILATLCVLFVLPAAAGEEPRTRGFVSEVRIGALLHDAPYMWSGFNKEPYAADLNVEVLFSPLAHFWGGSLSPALGATINFHGDTSKAYLDLRWQRQINEHWFWALGLGIAIHNGETFTPDPNAKQLGRRVLFHDVIEIGYRFNYHNSLSLYFEHISNASTADKNQGLDAIGLRYGYRF